MPGVTTEPAPSAAPSSEEPLPQPEKQKRPVVKIPSFVPDLNEFIYKDLDVESEAFLTEKETRDRQLSIELRARGIINTPSEPFTLSRKKEINELLEKGVFKLVPYDSQEIGSQRVFGSRLVDEVKGTGTNTLY